LEAQPASVVGPVVATVQVGVLADGILEAVRAGTPLLAIPQADALSDGVAKQLAGAGTFTTKLGKGKVVYQRVPEMHPVMQARFLANALSWLVS
jgi:hypothetical protein